MRPGGDGEPTGSVPWAGPMHESVARPRWLESHSGPVESVPFQEATPSPGSAFHEESDSFPIGPATAEIEAGLRAALDGTGLHGAALDEARIGLEGAIASGAPIDCGHDLEIAALHAELETLQAEVVALATAADRVRREILERSEADVVELASVLAERIVGRELATDRSLIARWASEGLRALADQQDGEVVVSPDVVEAVPQSAWVDGRGRPIVPRVDAALPPGSCEVRGQWSRIDGSAAARIRSVVDTIVGAGKR